MAQTQIHNQETIELLAGSFPTRNSNSFAWGNAISYYLNLPMLRGFWPMSSVNESGNPYDLSGQGRTLTNTNTATFGVYGLQPYTSVVGASSQYHTRADEAGLDITGNLTFGLWAYPIASAINRGVMLKGSGAGGAADSYWLYFNPASSIRCTVWNGVNPYGSPAIAFTNNSWYSWIGRYIPSTEVTVFCNDEKQSTVAGIPAAINNSANALSLGGFPPPASAFFTGYMCLSFLCAAALSDAQIYALHALTRPLFYGV